MRRLDPSRAVLFFWADLVFHEAALLADDEAKHLAVPVANLLTEFESVFKLDLDTRRALLQNSARASVADSNLDTAIRALHNAALFLVGQDRTKAEFKTLFSSPISKVVSYALKRQVEVADKLVENLGLKLYTDAFKSPHLNQLQTLISKGKTILASIRSAALSRTEARLDIRAWKDDANAIRLANYGELLAIAAKTGRKKDWAEAFFLSARNAPAELGDEEPVEEAPEGEPPTD